MKHGKKLLTLLMALTLVLLPLAGCADEGEDVQEDGQQNGQEDGQQEGTDQLRDVTVILDYTVNTNHTGMYVAQKLGYYEEQGLNVSIIEPADGVTPTLIATGKGDFGVSYQEDVTYGRASEDPLPVKAIAALIQHNTSGFASAADKNITSVKDFEGKVYAGWGSPSEEAIIRAVMEEAGADFSKLTMVTSDSATYHGLNDDQYDLIWMFEAWDGVAAARDGVELNYIELRDLDERLDYYTPILIASETMIEQEPETVRAFLAATEKGYRYAIENPEEAAGILHETASTYDLEMLVQSQELLATKYMEDSETWGTMKEEVWTNYTDFMLDSGLITVDVPANECFTNELLPQ